MKDLDYDKIAEDVKNMEQECIVVFDDNYEVELHNHDNYYEAEAEFNELENMTDRQLKKLGIMAFAYMSCYGLAGTGCREEADIDILPQIYDVCDKVGYIIAMTTGFYDEE